MIRSLTLSMSITLTGTIIWNSS